LQGEVVALHPGGELVVDAVRFQELAERALRAGPEAEEAVAALACWTGELLPEDPYEPWAEAPRQRLQLLHVELLRRAGRWDELVALDPTDEAAHLALMRAHAA